VSANIGSSSRSTFAGRNFHGVCDEQDGDGGPAVTGRRAVLRKHGGHLKNGVRPRIAVTPS
jgi:hypothetical protein